MWRILPITLDLLINQTLSASSYGELGGTTHLHKRVSLKPEPEPRGTDSLQEMLKTGKQVKQHHEEVIRLV